jgi:hypothetical protein
MIRYLILSFLICFANPLSAGDGGGTGGGPRPVTPVNESRTILGVGEGSGLDLRGDRLIIDLKKVQDLDLYLKNGNRIFLEDLKKSGVDALKNVDIKTGPVSNSDAVKLIMEMNK